MIQAYVDESGGKGQTKSFVFSALIAEATEWTTRADKWDQVLRTSPSIRYFKMDEAVMRDGEFRGFSERERNDKVKDLCRVVATPAIAALSVTMDIDDFLKLWAPRIGKPASEPYFFPFQGVHIAVAYELLSRGRTERCEIFFDEHKIFGPRAKIWYPVIRAGMSDELRAVMPIEPIFRDDKDVLPLQAADLTAWIQRMYRDKGNLGEFEWLIEELRGISVSRFSKVLDAAWFAEMAQAKEPAEEQLSRHDDIDRAYKEAFGFKWPPKTKPEKKRHSGR